jgi:DNA polymerase (family 10)
VENREAAALLDETATLMDLRGDNPFKIRAYQNVSRIIKGLETPLKDAVASGELASMKGIGKGMLQALTEIASTGTLADLAQLRSDVPTGLVELTHVPGLGAKRIKILHDTLGITGPGELEYACLENRLIELEGFGARTQASILEGLQFLRKTKDKHRVPVGLQEARVLLSILRDSLKVIRAEVAGSVRRHCEIIGDIDLLVSAKPVDFDNIADSFASAAAQGFELERTNGSLKFRHESGMDVELFLCTPNQFGWAWITTTGSRDHLEYLESRAASHGIKISGFNLLKSGATIAVSDEETGYKLLGLPWIPPEMREGRDEIALAEANAIPKLVESQDICGILHVHSEYSDGLSTLRQMAEAVLGRGYSYLGIADHSQAAAYAGGLKPDRIREQHKEIDRTNVRLAPFKIFKGIEADILGDGRIDYDDEILSSFDFVIASVHSKLRMSKQEATARILKALDNSHVRILGHPTGRLLLARDGYDLDMELVLDKCAEKRIAVELNAHPYRLDLDWRYHKMARDRGVLIAINPDAHHVDGLDDVSYGVGIARKGGCESKDILNCLTTEEISSFFARK